MDKKSFEKESEIYYAYKDFVNCVYEIEQLLLYIAVGKFEEYENKETLLMKYELLHSKLDNDIKFFEKLYPAEENLNPFLFQFYNCDTTNLHGKVHNYGNAIRTLLSYYFPTTK